jgi:hypothetical protein
MNYSILEFNSEFCLMFLGISKLGEKIKKKLWLKYIAKASA